MNCKIQNKQMYKKSRQQFMEQIRTIRKQLHQKLNNAPPQQTHLDRLVLAKQNLSSLQYQIPQGNTISTKQKVFQYNYDIPTTSKNRLLKDNKISAERRKGNQTQISSFYQNIQQKLKQYQKFVDQRQPIYQYRHGSIRSNRSMRLKSLPSKYNTRSNTTQPEQINFQQYFLQLSIARQKRKDSKLRQVLQYLRQNNKFFQKLDQYLSLCLLKIGFYHELYPGDMLYASNYDKNSIYVMLSGVMTLLNTNIGLKKLIIAGETFGQEMLFGSSPNRRLLQKAKCISKSYVFQMKLNDYTVLHEQCKKLGYLQQFDKFQDILRDGFTDKNIARNQHVIQRRIRMSY